MSQVNWLPLDGVGGTMQLKMTVEIWQRDKWFIAKCPELDFVSQGETAAGAQANLMELIQIQFEEMRVLGTLQDYLAECGYKVDGTQLTSQLELISFEQREVQVS